MTATVGLVMIVKNEADNLPRLAESVAAHIDRWTVVDTGSRDGTQDVARQVFKAVPGELIEDEWRGYGPSRNVALSAGAPHTDWLLTLDADDTLHGGIDRSQLALDFDAVEAGYRYAELRWWVPRLVRSAAGWEWQGRAHEYLTIPGGSPRSGRSHSFHVVHHADGGNRADKLEREIRLLCDDWNDGFDRARTAFYLARTYEDMGRAEQAAEWYRRRLTMDGWAEETWYAKWRLARCLLGSPATAHEGCGLLWSAWSERPWRAEPLWSLATHCRLTAQWPAGWQACAAAIRTCGVQPFSADPAQPPGGEDRLFVHSDVWSWRMAYEISIAAWYAGEREIGRQACEYLLAGGLLPNDLRPNVESNLRFYD